MKYFNNIHLCSGFKFSKKYEVFSIEWTKILSLCQKWEVKEAILSFQQQYYNVLNIVFQDAIGLQYK